MHFFKTLLSIVSFILGSVFASFAGVIAYRLPKKISIIKPNSYCPNCQNQLKAYDKIPLLSWIILGGKCRYCKSKIGILTLLIEIFGGIGFLLSYLQYGDSFEQLPIFVANMVMIFLFIIIASIDYETHNIYNFTLWIFAIISAFITIYRAIVFEMDIVNHIIGLVFGFLFLGAIKLISNLILKREGLGAGDVYLVGIAGFMLGVIPLLISIFVACIFAIIVECIKVKLSKTKIEEEIAFAPYLLLGIGLMAIYSETIANFYQEVIINAFI